MAARRTDFQQRYDWIRTSLCFEPRGHDMMSGGFLYPPSRPDCDVGILFIETSGCLPMCGHGTIGLVTFGLECGLIHPQTPGSLDEVLTALERDHEFLLRGDVFTQDVVDTWISYKRENEVDELRLRPHPMEFCMYYDM